MSIIYDHTIIAKSFPIYSTKRTLLFFVKFTLQNPTRLILTYHDDDDQETIDIPDNQPPIISPTVYLDPDDKSSWEGIRFVLHSMSIGCMSYEDRVIRNVANHVNNIIKAHYCPSDRAQLGPKHFGRRVKLSVSIARIFEHRVYEVGRVDGSTPADEAAIGRLKRIRADEYLEEKKVVDEKCGVCLEELLLMKGGKKKEVVTCLPCEHVFHEGCIVEWLKISHFCPLCRFELPVRKQPKLHS